MGRIKKNRNNRRYKRNERRRLEKQKAKSRSKSKTNSKSSSSFARTYLPFVISLAAVSVPACFYFNSKFKQEEKPAIVEPVIEEKDSGLDSNPKQSGLESKLNLRGDDLDKAIGKYTHTKYQFHGNSDMKLYVVGFTHNYIGRVNGKVVEELRPENVPVVQANYYKILESLIKDFNVKNFLCEGSDPNVYKATEKVKKIQSSKYEDLVKHFSNTDSAAFTSFKATNPDLVTYYGFDSEKLLDDTHKNQMSIRRNDSLKEALSHLPGQEAVKQATESERALYNLIQSNLNHKRTDQFFVNTLTFLEDYTKVLKGDCVSNMGIGHVPRYIHLLSKEFKGDIYLIIPKGIQENTIKRMEDEFLAYGYKL
ncbi:hypothetical protein KY321_04825 [Candidatus Woesearchaeota archaeon]|nr:hypothetical protein [Candidatus Woesearchaeota archaeon]